MGEGAHKLKLLRELYAAHSFFSSILPCVCVSLFRDSFSLFYSVFGRRSVIVRVIYFFAAIFDSVYLHARG